MTQRAGNRRNKYLLKEQTIVECYYNHHIYTPKSKSESYSLEYSIHSCPILLRDDMTQLFPHLSAETVKANLLIIPIVMPTSEPLTEMGEESKSNLREDFVYFARQFVNKMRMRGRDNDITNYWADFIDPASGLPIYSKSGHAANYSDANLFELLLKYPSETSRLNAEKVVCHPKHGTCVFPGVIFTIAPIEVTQQIIDEISSIRPCNCHC